MNVVFFGLKRAYYATLKTPRVPLARIGMTAARFDLMKAVSRYRRLLQKELRNILSVAGATLSKMLKLLEARGLVTRTHGEDRRTRVVELTFAGELALVRADELDVPDPAGNDATDIFLELPGADGAWYWNVAMLGGFDEQEEDIQRMVRILGPAFGPYEPYDHC
jgi:DNA-binding MarR family transcriptional regulator